jgi:ketosteroid isomerase-like protein
MRLTRTISLTAVAVLTFGVPGLLGSWAIAQPADQHQEKPAGGCCAKHSASAATSEHEKHQQAAMIGEDAVLNVVRAWLDAIPKRDTARITEVLAEDFVAILPDGRRRIKSEHLKEVADRKYAVQTLTMEDPNVRFFGTVAIVTYYQGEESRTNGADTSGSSVWTDILVNRNGMWQIVAEHGSRFN